MVNKKRKICVVTGTRAEYGILFQLLKGLKKEKLFDLKLIVTGMHLSPEFGLTYKEIIKDGFKIDKKIEMIVSGDTPSDISKSVGIGFIGFSEAYKDIKPDLIIVLGDRYELLAASYTANIFGIPICHIHGGESTEGLIDEATRHSITKMSHLHMVANKVYFKRVEQLGEQKNRIFLVGGLGIDNIKKFKFLKKNILEKELGFKFGKKNLLVTFHPVTLEKNTTEVHFKNLLDALNSFSEIKVIFTKPNSDTYGRKIIYMIDEYVKNNPDRACSFVSLGQMRYLSTLKYIDGVVGNSSSGLLEVPTFKKGTINIGNRQKNRLKATSVIDCKPNKMEIINSIKKIYSKSFKERIRNTVNPYGNGGASNKVIKILKKINYENLLLKKFNDIK